MSVTAEAPLNELLRRADASMSPLLGIRVAIKRRVKAEKKKRKKTDNAFKISPETSETPTHNGETPSFAASATGVLCENNQTLFSGPS